MLEKAGPSYIYRTKNEAYYLPEQSSRVYLWRYDTHIPALLRLVLHLIRRFM